MEDIKTLQSDVIMESNDETKEKEHTSNDIIIKRELSNMNNDINQKIDIATKLDITSTISIDPKTEIKPQIDIGLVENKQIKTEPMQMKVSLEHPMMPVPVTIPIKTSNPPHIGQPIVMSAPIAQNVVLGSMPATLTPNSNNIQQIVLPKPPIIIGQQPLQPNSNQQQLQQLKLQFESRKNSQISDPNAKLLEKKRLQDLVKEVDPMEQLDEEVEECLLQLTDDFIDTVVNAACRLAKHRNSNCVEVKDVQLHLERSWNMYIPGYGSTEESRPYKRSASTEAHRQRVALIKKLQRKY